MAANSSYRPRKLEQAELGDPALGPLRYLPGKWRSDGRGWNMIALPGVDPSGDFPPPFRLLMNHYNEDLVFKFVDDGVPNRGLKTVRRRPTDNDQFLVALDYEQSIDQLVAEDFPDSGGKAGPDGAPIHHEPGLWLHMLNELTDNLDIARLATIPHGDSVLALGTSEEVDGLASIPDFNGLPIGVPQDIDGLYNAPYKHYETEPFFGDPRLKLKEIPGFPGFHPLNLNAILQFSNEQLADDAVESTMILDVDSTVATGGIVNIPFVVKQANAASMRSTFWIQKLKGHTDEEPKLRMQYFQVVILDFLERRDGNPGLIRWPHVSINTLDWVGPCDE